MELNQYNYMFESEDRLWWYVGNHEHFMSLLKRKKILKDNIHVLDAGCGTGKWIELLKSSNNIHETGMDFQELALSLARTRGNFNFIQGDVNQCLFKPNSFDLITCFDVLCNEKVDNKTALQHFNSYLTQGGHLLLTLPAYNFLKSTHDKAVHTGKRYTKTQVKRLLKEAGFDTVKVTYTVSLLFPLALLKRLADRTAKRNPLEHNEVKVPSPFVNRFLLSVLRIENFFLRYISLPFGLSVVVLAKKKSS